MAFPYYTRKPVVFSHRCSSAVKSKQKKSGKLSLKLEKKGKDIYPAW